MKNIRFVLYLLKLQGNISFIAISELSQNTILVCHVHINMRTTTNIS